MVHYGISSDPKRMETNVLDAPTGKCVKAVRIITLHAVVRKVITKGYILSENSPVPGEFSFGK